MPARLLVHEPIARLVRYLRPVAEAAGGRVVETRSEADLLRSIVGVSRPVVVFADSRSTRERCATLLAVREACPSALIVALAEDSAKPIEREAGATMVLPRTVPPPQLIDQVSRLIRLAEASSPGWSPDGDPRPEPWEAMLLSD